MSLPNPPVWIERLRPHPDYKRATPTLCLSGWSVDWWGPDQAAEMDVDLDGDLEAVTIRLTRRQRLRLSWSLFLSIFSLRREGVSE